MDLSRINFTVNKRVLVYGRQAAIGGQKGSLHGCIRRVNGSSGFSYMHKIYRLWYCDINLRYAGPKHLVRWDELQSMRLSMVIQKTHSAGLLSELPLALYQRLAWLARFQVPGDTICAL